MICKRISTDQNVYKRAITFLYGTKKEINAYAKQKYDDAELLRPSAIGNWSIFTQSGYEEDVISIVRCDEEIGALVHEISHHAIYVFTTQLKLKIDGGSEGGDDEPYCYYHEWLFEQCYRFMKKR